MSFRSLWPPIAWAVIILILSGIPGNYIPRVITFREWLGPDKIVHLGMFGVFAFLLLRGINQQYQKPVRRLSIVLIVLVIGTIFGFILEVLQRYVFVGRSGNPYDMAADIIGLIGGIAVFYIFFERNRRSDTK